MENEASSLDRKQFDGKYANASDREIQKELLYAQQKTLESLKRIQTNTSVLVWFLVVIPTFVAILAFLRIFS